MASLPAVANKPRGKIQFRIRLKKDQVPILNTCAETLNPDLTANVVAADIVDQCLAFVLDPSKTPPIPAILLELRQKLHGTGTSLRVAEGPFIKLTPEVEAAIEKMVISKIEAHLSPSVKAVINSDDPEKKEVE